MLRIHSTGLALVALAAGVAAQIPDGYLLVAARNDSMQMIDPSVGVATPVFSRVAGNTLTDVLGACPDPFSSTTLYAFGSTGGFLGPEVRIHFFPGTNNVNIPLVSFSPTGFPGFSFPKRCVRVGGVGLATVISGGSNNGLWMIDLTAQTASSAILVSSSTDGFAEHVAAIGSNVYLATEASTTGPSAIYEWNTLTSTSRVVASGLTQSLRSMAAFGGELMVGDDMGTVYSVDRTSGVLTPAISTGLGLPIVAIASKGGAGDPVYLGVQDTDGMGNRLDKVYDSANLSASIWDYPATPTGGIQQLWVGTDTQAVQLDFGQGCPTSAMTTPHHRHLGSPSLGNADFRIGLTEALPSGIVALHVGVSRTVWSGGSLPFDLSVIGMTGCELYTEPVFAVGATTDSLGEASIPVPVPPDITSFGVSLVSQWVVLDATANPLGIVASDGEQNIEK